MNRTEPQPLRVLVVEDSETDHELLLIALRRGGYAATALRVEDEASMREALAQGEWDVVISDHHLPAFTALEALRTLQSANLDVPFIIVSGAIGEDAAVAAMQSGADDYVQKDRLARLAPAIRRSMRAARTRARERAAEAALRESEARLRAIAANLPGMLFRMQTDDEGDRLVFTYVSDGVQSLLGITPQRLIEDPALLVQCIETTHRTQFRTALAHAALARARLRWEGPAVARGRYVADPERWIRIDATPRVAETPGIVWDGLATDISALMRAQTELYASHEELRRLSSHLERAKEHERARIAREIHDDIGGTLTGLRAELAWIKKRYAGEPGMAERLDSMGSLLDSAMQASVRIARDLRPPILDFGLAEAMAWQAKDFQKRTGIACRFRSAQDIELDADRATAVFRIFQELLTNIAKHARARHVEIRLDADTTHLQLHVEDDGVGLTEADRAKHDSYGIRGMTERARELDGRLVLHERPRGGTRALLELPRAGTCGGQR